MSEAKVYELVTGKQEVKDYPYGRLRTSMFFSVEFQPKKGYRSVRQTINPKTGRLNKPKKSTYSFFVYMVKDKSNGHISFSHLGGRGLKDLKNTFEKIESLKIKLTEPERSYLIATYTSYIKVEAQATLQYTFNTYNSRNETDKFNEQIDFVHKHQGESYKYLLDRLHYGQALKVYSKEGTIKEMLKAMPSTFDITIEEVVSHLEKNVVGKVGTKNATDKTKTKNKTDMKKVKAKAPKKATAKKSAKKTTAKAKATPKKATAKKSTPKRQSLKDLATSKKNNEKVLYVVYRVRKIVGQKMSDNAKASKKSAKEIVQINKRLSNSMSGIKAGLLSTTDDKVLRPIANSLKPIIEDMSNDKYSAKMKEVFDSLSEQFPQATRKAKKTVISKDFLNF